MPTLVVPPHHHHHHQPYTYTYNYTPSADVLWLLHVKAAPRPAPQPSAVTSHLPRTLDTSFFAAPSMAPADVAALSGDMALARSIRFLPYRSPDDCIDAIRAFSKQQKRKHPSNQNHNYKNRQNIGDEIRAPLIPEEWYPGFWYYVKLRGEYIARHPAVRSVSNRGRFLRRRDDDDDSW
ncbi:hypothetical protein Dda_0616 [Drechslerella dactyloides]|uniref:Uncharacterized protein n=1 Tax=Drechslerella dactyloides TaxID=74499 RepID=A0AAD6J575_DREDA|nr:hypothetical protein Dda_0616 [Drechslerella dactyloides]